MQSDSRSISGFVEITELQGQRARWVTDANITNTKKGGREEGSWEPRAGVAWREAEESHGKYPVT